MTKPLRVGLVGAGPWAGAVHAPALTAHPGVTLAGVWTRTPGATAAFADTTGTAGYDRFPELLDDVDVVAFAVPPAVQASLALDAARAGRHLVLEKPLADSLAGARLLADTVRRAGVTSSMVLTLRHDPAVRGFLAGLPARPPAADTVGVARWLSGALLGGPYSRSLWRAEQANGALLDVGPHVVDLLDAALGPVVDVTRARHAEPDLWEFGLRHAGGAQSSATLSLRLPVDPSEVEVAVFGSAGSHRFAGRVADARACYGALLDELVDAVHGVGPRLALDVERGLRLQETIDRIRALALR